MKRLTTGYSKGKPFKKDIIFVAVSYRDASEILKKRMILVHPITIMR